VCETGSVADGGRGFSSAETTGKLRSGRIKCACCAVEAEQLPVTFNNFAGRIKDSGGGA